ncbi:hypothetical protein AB0L70_29425 [Kribbella sp. NPDC051952]|uniref:hypothetical protein n=1 Tax=Kribbella sp. NPDC051952 TaxID=3154851 RepID=UPI0034172FEF
MTSDDLRHLFRTMAAEGTETVKVDEHALVPRIRRKRRRRLAGTGLAGLAATAVIAAGAYAVLPENGVEPSARPESAVQPSASTTGLPLSPCGQVVPPGFPPSVPSGLDGLALSRQTFHKTATGWTGTLRFAAPDPRGRDWVAPTTQFEVTQGRKIAGRAELTVTAKTPKTVEATLDVTSCDDRLRPGPILLIGKLFPGQHPITFFQVDLR